MKILRPSKIARSNQRKIKVSEEELKNSISPASKRELVLLKQLMLLYEATVKITSPKTFKMTEHILKTGLPRNILDILYREKIIVKINGGRMATYRWNSIRPSLMMAKRLLEDANKPAPVIEKNDSHAFNMRDIEAAVASAIEPLALQIKYLTSLIASSNQLHANH